MLKSQNLTQNVFEIYFYSNGKSVTKRPPEKTTPRTSTRIVTLKKNPEDDFEDLSVEGYGQNFVIVENVHFFRKYQIKEIPTTI